MNISKPDFLLLNLPGIDLFLELVDGMVQANKGASFEECARYLRTEIHEYSKRRDAFRARPVASALAAPLTLSIAELLDRKTCSRPDFRGVRANVVYIVRDGEQVRYVGSTRYNARRRMKSHQKSHSPLGQALRENPAATDWTVEMIPHADYQTAAAKEKELITHLNPTFCRRI